MQRLRIFLGLTLSFLVAGCAKIDTPEPVVKESSDAANPFMIESELPYSGYRKDRKDILDTGIELYELRADAASHDLSDTPPVEAQWLALHAKLIIVDREHDALVSLLHRDGCGNCFRGLQVLDQFFDVGWKSDSKDGSLANLALHRNPAAHHLAELLADREPKAGAAVVACCRAVGL